MSALPLSHRLAIAFLALGAPACGGAYAGSSYGAAARVPLAPPGVFVDQDVADGYLADTAALAPYGRWESDAAYGVHWCPASSAAGTAFHPYESGGHWTTTDHAEYGSPAGTVAWTEDDRRPWAELTTHAGWWIDRGGNDWCWVPGLQQTPARVVWREGDGFVGWAPEPPAWIDDGGDDADAGFEWRFELLGTLLEDSLDGNVLTGDAAQCAQRATAPSLHADDPDGRITRRPPARPTVVAAHRQLAALARAHAGDAPATTTAPARAPTSTVAATSPSSGGSSTGSSSHKSSPTDGDEARADLSVDRLPPGALLVPMMMNGPVEGRGAVSFAPSGSTYGPSSGSYGASGSYGPGVAAQGSSARRYDHASASGGGGHGYRSYSRSSSHSSSSGSSHSSSGSSHSSHRR